MVSEQARGEPRPLYPTDVVPWVVSRHPTPSRGGTFGLLYCGGVEEVSELTVDPSPLRGRGLGHCPEWHRCCRDVLASAIEDRGLLAPFVVVDAVVDVASPLPGYSAITATSLLLLESVSELL